MGNLNPLVFVHYLQNCKEAHSRRLGQYHELERPLQQLMNSFGRFDLDEFMENLNSKFSAKDIIEGMDFILRKYIELDRSPTPVPVDEKVSSCSLAAFVLFLVAANKSYDFSALRESIWDTTVTARFSFPNLEFWRLLGKWFSAEELARRSLPLAVHDDPGLRRFAMMVLYLTDCKVDLISKFICDAMSLETESLRIERYRKLKFKFGKFNRILRTCFLPSTNPFIAVE